MRRRDFVTLLGGAVAWPIAAHAQEAGRIYRLGFLAGRPRAIPEYDAFFDELRRNGFIEGQNLIVDARGFGLRHEQFAEIAAALARSNPDVIFSGGGDPAMHALKAATQIVPIVGGAEDMVASGLVASLSRPGGNITGVSMLSPELDGKRLDILIEAVPSGRRMGALADLTQTPQSHIKALQDAARSRRVELSVFGVARSEDIASATEAAKTSGAQAVNVLASSLLSENRRLIIERMAALRLPAIYQWPEIADEGGFAAYGPRQTLLYRQRAQTVVKILRGAKPADIPVEQPAQFELVINLQAAKEIGHEVPAGLALRADKLIE
jgi:putative ABC transport system substrate-binding protein